MSEQQKECEHNWQYQGVVWSLGKQIHASSARDVKYEDHYYCTKCLTVRDRNARVHENSYSKRIEGSFPK